MALLAACRALLAATCMVAATATTPDAVTSLPGFGTLRDRVFAGFVEVNATYDKNLFYWFVEAASGSEPRVTPTLIWMNGGPGASSLMGLLTENIGPLTLDLDGSLKENPHAWSRLYNILAFDNPVGSGYSYTRKGGYVTNEEEMRHDYYAGLTAFFELHPEYRHNPLWVTGESYGGKYVPNVAYEIHLRGELQLKGVIIGNGVYDGRIQYPTIPQFAYMQGLIDQQMLGHFQEKFHHCVELIDGQALAEAERFCEDTVRSLYASNESAGGIFYYDVGMADGNFLDDLTAAMGRFLNNPSTRAALHVGNHTWGQADESGPVSDALVKDFVTSQGLSILSSLIDAGKGYRVVTYNGVRDGSVCNHVGNALAMDQMKWSGQAAFREVQTKPWRLDGKLVGYEKSYGALTYHTILRTGHLVPTVVPEVALGMLRQVVGAGVASVALAPSAPLVV
mmetsp:Transcript_71885/g.158986  ORF Transcript_71885/g.158986 Transcript_71885/m.158986 type:complete len:451 (+) Transcript_71885:65-1417(+)